MPEESTGIRCVGGIVHDPAGRLLIIQRGHAPSLGLWTVPGGRVEQGESDHTALRRELLEETGLTVRVQRLAGTLERAPYVIYDYACSPLDGRLQAGDDAAQARWVDRHAFERLARAGALTEGLAELLADWNMLPARATPQPPSQ